MGFAAVYHLHTYRCKHASGDAIDYARVAVEGGCPVVGFSDHVPTPDGRWNDCRMDMSQLPDYEAAVAAARAAFPKLTVLLGMECEYTEEFASFYRDELLSRRGYDYLIGACHYTPMAGKWISSFSALTTPAALRAHAAYAIRSMESGLFAFLAHPDIFACCYPEWTADTAACARDICAAAVALGLPLEINGYGLRKRTIGPPDTPRPPYPWRPFWEVAAEYPVRVVLSSDAHRPQDTLADHDKLAAWRDDFDLVEAAPLTARSGASPKPVQNPSPPKPGPSPAATITR
jgi:histidinol-phosphatase (PHP family)